MGSCRGSHLFALKSLSVVTVAVMRKFCLIVISLGTGRIDARLRMGRLLLTALLAAGIGPINAQDPKFSPLQAETQFDAQIRYPLNLAVDQQGRISTVDLDLPGVWRTVAKGQPTQLFFRGSGQLRRPMNRPRCIAALDDGSVVVGDSASRNLYRIGAAETELIGLAEGGIGIPMCIAVAPDEKSLFVGDAETRMVFRLPMQGGPPQKFAQVNARGLSFADDGVLWAVTPDDAAIVMISPDGSFSKLLQGRPFRYPGGITHLAGKAFVTDGYGQAIWRVTAAGDAKLWYQGTPLKHPVGIATHGEVHFVVADPHQRELFLFDARRADEPERLFNR